jgi:hypothetical protein
METSTRIISHPCYLICEYVLSITTSNVVWWDKNLKTIFQEELTAKLNTVCKLKSEREGIYVQK